MQWIFKGHRFDVKEESISVRSHASMGMLLAFAVALYGCGNSGNGGSTGTQPDESQPTEVVSVPKASTPQGPAPVSSAVTSLGSLLVSDEGFTLYILSKDLMNTPSCYGDCMQLWPPLLTDGSPQAGEGVDPSRLGVATRHDATFQVTYFGHPLYLYRGDTDPGDILGHGIEDLWQVLPASGVLIDEPSAGTVGDTPATSDDEDYNSDDNY